MDLAVLCDFDGTIAEIDTAVIVFNRFINGNWRIFNERLDRGEISLEECMREQFSMIKAPESVILDELDLDVAFRPGFEELVEYCIEYQISFEIVSAGLDFVINHLLVARGLRGTKVHAAKTRFTEGGLAMAPLELHDSNSVDFKEDLVNRYKSKGFSVVYIGDGMSDKGAVMSADLVFAVKGSGLAEFCTVEGIDYQDVVDFHEVITVIKRMK